MLSNVNKIFFYCFVNKKSREAYVLPVVITCLWNRFRYLPAARYIRQQVLSKYNLMGLPLRLELRIRANLALIRSISPLFYQLNYGSMAAGEKFESPSVWNQNPAFFQLNYPAIKKFHFPCHSAILRPTKNRLNPEASRILLRLGDFKL